MSRPLVFSRNLGEGSFASIDHLHRDGSYHETATHLFVHANYAPTAPLEEQSFDTLLRTDLHKLSEPVNFDDLPGPHSSGKIAIVGHTPQKSGKILDVGHLKCIDTGCGYASWTAGLLTALDMDSGQVWQVTENGQLPNRHR